MKLSVKRRLTKRWITETLTLFWNIKYIELPKGERSRNLVRFPPFFRFSANCTLVAALPAPLRCSRPETRPVSLPSGFYPSGKPKIWSKWSGRRASVNKNHCGLWKKEIQTGWSSCERNQHLYPRPAVPASRGERPVRAERPPGSRQGSRGLTSVTAGACLWNSVWGVLTRGHVEESDVRGWLRPPGCQHRWFAGAMVRETRHLWVGNLPENVSKERIKEYFNRWTTPQRFLSQFNGT